MVIMMKERIVSRQVMALALLIGLFLGAVFIGAVALNAAPVSAQTSGGEAEDEANEADDGAEGPGIPIKGDALGQASAVALEYIGEGRVTGTEVGDEEGYYEVEITRENGRQVDVHLDEAFNVLGHEND
jgi:hypothetical protein